MVEFLDPFFLIKTVGLLGVFAIVFIESGLFFGFFFPGDSLLFTAGLLASQGYFSVSLLVAGSLVASFLGNLVGYSFGKSVGTALFSREDSFFFHKKHLEKAKSYYEKHGRSTIIFARFFPVVRTFAPILAGVGRMEYTVFVSFSALGSILWVSLACFGGYYLGRIVPDVERYILPIVIAIIAVSFLPALISALRRPKQ